ncbi:MAG: SpoIIE family protein phosphatase [Flavobacteriia bacterium]|nr:SpoIIE family protein phosphatase [Flavobacteriia bacterium]
MHKHYLIYFFFFYFIQLCHSQQIVKNGVYPNHLFSVSDIGSSVQIRSGDQGTNHNVYFGNDNIILEFNGQNWSRIQTIKNKFSKNEYDKINRSRVNKILTCSDGITYISRENSFGKLEHDSLGRTIYNPFSLKGKQNVKGVFNIIENKNCIYFISENSIFINKKNHINTISIPTKYKDFSFISCVLADENNFFLILNHNSDFNRFVYLNFNLITKEFNNIQNNSKNVLQNIRGCIKKNQQLVLITQDNLTFNYLLNYKSLTDNHDIQNKFNELGIKYIKSFKEYHNQYLIGTKLDGLYVLDDKFNPIRQFSTNDGMENLEVNHFFKGIENNLWICLDNGLHFFETSSPLTYLNKNFGITDYVYKINFNNQFAYLGLSTIGLLKQKNNTFDKTFENTNLFDQSVWEVKSFNTPFGKKNIVIADDGIYEFNPYNKTKKLILNIYAWSIIQNPNNKSEFYVGCEGSFLLLKLKNETTWENIILKDDINENVRSLKYFKGNVILGVENKGILIYNILEGRFKTLYQNIISNYRIEVFENKVYIGMTTGLYYLNKSYTQLLPFIEFNRKFIGDNNLAVFRLYNEKEKNRMWIVTSVEDDNSNSVFHTCWIKKVNNKWECVEWPLSNLQHLKADAIFDIQYRSQNETWLAGNKGVFILNEKNIESINKEFKIQVDEIKINNQCFYYNYNNANIENPIPFDKNSIYFSFHANTFSGIKKIEYRYKLLNYNDKWSDWSFMNFANFQKLPESNYTLIVEAKNYYGFVSKTLKINFTILPPWYRTWWAYLTYIIIIIFLIYSSIQISIQRVKNQNLKLEGIVQERTHEIAEQNKILEVQKIEIEQKSKDIVDSIVYAKRIQETILPDERMHEYFSDFFVFYRPKDIVSGDFYWARKKENQIIFSVLDCTGHGVPGALVSIVGNAALLRCVNEHKLTEPSEILDKLRDIVVRSFDKKGEVDVKDGMDMSLCSLNQDTLLLKYSGANNDCIIVRDNELIELKPDKQPIGYFSHATPFSQHEFQLKKGDCIYQFTDGYVDQFGGEKGKKLKSKPFKEFLKEIAYLPMEKQSVLVQEKFDSWKGDYDQVDDVCVLGVKII